MKCANDYYKEYNKAFAKLSDSELVDRFNNVVGVHSFGIARQGHSQALKNQFIERGIDYSSVGSLKQLSYKHKIYLKNKRLYRLYD